MPLMYPSVRAQLPDGMSKLYSGEFMVKRGSCRHTWHPTRRALGVAAMRRGERLDVQEHTRNARRSRRTVSSIKC